MKVVSLFSGAGGLDLGFIQAGHTIIWSNDVYEDAVETYKLNIGKHIDSRDIRDINSEEIPNCDIIIGGFPCQGFSVANTKRCEEDSRNFLYMEMLRIIRDKRPKYFVAENVKGILSLGKGKVISMIISDFKDSGYRVKYKVLNAADYGVPQKRYRVFIIGIRDDLKDEISFPQNTHADPSLNPQPPIKQWVSIGEALADIPEPYENTELINHTYSKYKLQFNGYLGHRIVDGGKPAPTVTGRGDDRGGVVVLPHPNSHRRMSARELAITQSFPHDFEFCGCQSSVYRQIANAVPPFMAKAMASCFPSN